MANVTSGQTWKLDTAGSVYTDPVKIKKIRWTGIATDSDDLVVNESNNGNPILAAKGKATYDMEFDYGEGTWYKGFYLQTLDSGTVYVDVA